MTVRMVRLSEARSVTMLAMTQETWGPGLTRARERAMLSQRQLAMRIGASSTAIQTWERGVHFPERKWWPQLVAALPGLTVEQLEEWRGERKPAQVNRDELEQVIEAMREVTRALDEQTTVLHDVMRILRESATESDE